MIGRSLNHYRVLAALGRGGMGEVYVAEDTKLRRKVALKVLPATLSQDPERTWRFQREARALAALNHPNIVTIFSIEECDELHFLTMELVDGQTLDEIIPASGLSFDSFFRLALPIVEGLAAAHGQGVVHRDLKPRNIMVDTKENPKILDFGLARRVEMSASRAEDSTVTVTMEHQVMGTLSYMSPEQVEMRDVDHRSDIFVLGIVFYEMLSGTRPFTGGSSIAVMTAILRDTPRPLRELRPDLPDGLTRVVEKCLAKAAESRHQSTVDLLKELQKSQAATGTESPAESKALLARSRQRHQQETSVSRRSRWRKVLVSAALVLVLLAVGGILRWRVFGPEMQAVASLAIIGFQNLTPPADAATVAGITTLVNVGVLEANPCRVVSPEYLLDLRRRHFAGSSGPIGGNEALELARLAGATVLLSGDIGTLGGSSYLAWRLVDTATGESLGGQRASGESLTDLVDQVVGGVVPLLATGTAGDTVLARTPVAQITTGSPQAYQHYIAGNLALDEGRTVDAIRLYERAIALDSTFALAHLALGGAHWWEADLRDRYLDRAWELRRHLGTKDKLRLEVARLNRQWEYEAATAVYRKMLERWPDDRVMIESSASGLMSNWYSTEALPILRSGVGFYPDDPDLCELYQQCLSNTGRLEEANAFIRSYLSRRPDDIAMQDALAWCSLNLGLPDSAEAAVREVLRIDPQFRYGERDILAQCAYTHGDLAGAIEIKEDILEQANLAPADRVVALVGWGQFGLRNYYQDAGRYRDALETIEAARQVVRGADAEWRLDIVLVRTLCDMGRADSAIAFMRQPETSGNQKSPPWSRYDDMTRAHVLIHADSLDAARRSLAKVLALDEAWAQTQGNLAAAHLAIRQGNADSALTFLRRSEEYGTPVQPGMVYTQMFNLHYQAQIAKLQNNLELATQKYRELLRPFSGFTRARFELAELYAQRGQFEEAEAEWRKCLELWADADPDLPELAVVRQRLDRLGRER